MKALRNVARLLILTLAAFALPACGDSEDSPPDGPPPVPTSLEQVDDLGEQIPAGGVVGESCLVLRARATPLHASLPVKLWVELLVNGRSLFFNSTESAATATLSVPVQGLLPGRYRWRAWCQDGKGRKSPQVEMGGGPTLDFVLDPSLPTRLEQVRVDGFTEIAAGAAVPERVALFRARVHSAHGTLVRARFELKPLGTPLDGSGEFAGTQVAAGSWSEAQLPLTVGPCHWRAWTESYSETLGAAVEFGEDPTAADLIRNPPAPPAPVPSPIVVNQYFTSGLTAIPVGGSTIEEEVLFTGRMSGTSFMALEVEIKPVGLAFDGMETRIGIFVPSGDFSNLLEPLPLGSWHWRSRTAADTGDVSPWIAFGGNFEGIPAAADLTRWNGWPATPSAPRNLRQFRLDGRTPIPYGEEIPETGFVTQALLQDADQGEALMLEVEVRPSGTGFQGVPTHAGSPIGSGGTASLTIERLTPDTFYRWQARTRDARGNVSGWTLFSAPPVTDSGSGSSSGSVRSGSNCSGSCGIDGGAAAWMGLLGLATLLALNGRKTP